MFARAERSEQAANDTHAETTRRAEAARLDAATSEERRSSLVRLRDTLDEQVAATEKRIADDEERLRALAAQERDARGRMDAARAELGTATADAREADRKADRPEARAGDVWLIVARFQTPTRTDSIDWRCGSSTT